MIEAVIFDMDGVITDTSVIHAAAESRVLAEAGINITPEDIVKTYSGFKDTDTFQYILQKHAMKADCNKLWEDKWRIIYSGPLRQNIVPIAGVKQFIEGLKSENYPIAVASSAPLEFITFVLEALELNDKFSILTSGDEVKTGKPDPAVFLLTAQKLHISPDRCLVIEDAPHGIKAAKAAGMKCLGITTTHKREELEGADRIIVGFGEVSIKEIQRL